MRARFFTICRRCRKPIRPGQTIILVGRALHLGCKPDPPRPRKDNEQLQKKLDSCERSGAR
jgi:hypothetical protein